MICLRAHHTSSESLVVGVGTWPHHTGGEGDGGTGEASKTPHSFVINDMCAEGGAGSLVKRPLSCPWLRGSGGSRG